MAEGKTGKRRCSVLTKSGTQCRGTALSDREYCAVHSPEAIEGRRQGGVNRSNARRSMKVAPADMRQIADLISVAIQRVNDDKMDPRALSSMASGATALVRILELVLLRSELDALRDQVAQLQAQRTIEGGSRI